MLELYNIILYQPLLNLLAVLYEFVTFHSMGLSIIFLTLIIRFILFPVFYKIAHHQRKIQALQPHIKRIQETHKADKVKQNQVMMELYKEHGVNPMGPILLMLIQLPVLLALYSVFRGGFSADALKSLYSFIPQPGVINNTFLGIDLLVPNLVIVVIAAVLQYIQARLTIIKTPKTNEPSATDKMGQNMAFMSPILTLVILYRLPAGIALYWLTGIVFAIFQQILINKHIRTDFNKVEHIKK